MARTIRELLDENGEMDEIKCLGFLMLPQLATIQNLQTNQGQRAFVMLKPAESCYSELTEGYVLKIIEAPPSSGPQQNNRAKGKVLHEILLSQVDNIVMKNLI